MSVTVLTALVALAAVAVIYAGSTLASARCRDAFMRGAGPMLAALAGAFGIVLPAFIVFEPPHAGEAHGVLLPALAGAGAALLATWSWRAGRLVAATHRLVARWEREGRAIPTGPWGMNVTAIDAGLPIVAVGGILRPHLFVDRTVLEQCSPAELTVIAAHERAHVRSLDNLRALLVAACSGTQSAAAVRWRESAEYAADRRAAASPAAAVSLAGALVKLARIGPARSFDRVLVSTIHDTAILEKRVQRLLAVAAPDRSGRRTDRLVWLLVIAAAPLAMPSVLSATYRGVEFLVRTLP